MARIESLTSAPILAHEILRAPLCNLRFSLVFAISYRTKKFITFIFLQIDNFDKTTARILFYKVPKFIQTSECKQKQITYLDIVDNPLSGCESGLCL